MDNSQLNVNPMSVRSRQELVDQEPRFFLLYMLREGTSLFVSTYAVILLVGLCA